MGLPPLLQSRIDQVIHKVGSETNQTIKASIFYRDDVTPIAQQGPQCGIVALHMAHAMVGGEEKREGTSIDRYMQRAKEMQLTNNGEMFSAEWLAQLSTDVRSDVVAECASMPSCSGDLVDLLHDRRTALLLPYDCDKNHEPTLANGHKAHWCLIVGVLFVETQENDTNPENTPDGPRFTLARLSVADEWPSPTPRTHLLAYHGKSKHAGVWPMHALITSNAQLHELGPERGKDGMEYRLPMGGLSEGLCAKIVILRRRDNLLNGI